MKSHYIVDVSVRKVFSWSKFTEKFSRQRQKQNFLICTKTISSFVCHGANHAKLIMHSKVTLCVMCSLSYPHESVSGRTSCLTAPSQAQALSAMPQCSGLEYCIYNHPLPLLAVDTAVLNMNTTRLQDTDAHGTQLSWMPCFIMIMPDIFQAMMNVMKKKMLRHCGLCNANN